VGVGSAVSSTQRAFHQPSAVVIAITRRGSQLAVKLATELEAEVAIPIKHFGFWISDFGLDLEKSKIQNPQSKITYADSALAEVRRCWPTYSQLVLVMPAGVAVRAIAPLLGHKASDPTVVCLDEVGQSVIPLLGGHQAGANELARRIAGITGGYAAITTASDVQGKPALDLPPLTPPIPPLSRGGQGGGIRWRIDPTSALTYASACLVNDEPIGVYIDPALVAVRQQTLDWLGQADNLILLDSLDELDVDAYAAGIIVSHRTLGERHQHLLHKSVLYHPPVLVVGMGCKRGVPVSELQAALEAMLTDSNLAPESIAALATVDFKADEPGLQTLAAELGVPLQIVESARLASLESVSFSPSAAQEKFDLPGVAEPCAVLVSGGQLIVPKRSFARCTVAVALKG
jgi:cobalt-precorrin 5A hydrolase/precorrin-3B C17-methyltransferase